MKINKKQIIILWYGSIILGSFLLRIGLQTEQSLLLVFSIIQFIVVSFIIAGSEHQNKIIRNWKTIILTILIFISSLIIFSIIFEDFGTSHVF